MGDSRLLGVARTHVGRTFLFEWRCYDFRENKDEYIGLG